MKITNIDAEKFLNDMITDFENRADMKPDETVIYKAMLFGSVKFAVIMNAITNSVGEKFRKRLEKVKANTQEGGEIRWENL